MKNTATYRFHTISGSIPGIINPKSPDGLFHAGQIVTIDTDTMEILEIKLEHQENISPFRQIVQELEKPPMIEKEEENA